jgi:hypothetical protein
VAFSTYFIGASLLLLIVIMIIDLSTPVPRSSDPVYITIVILIFQSRCSLYKEMHSLYEVENAIFCGLKHCKTRLR